MELPKHDPMKKLSALEAEEERRAKEAIRCYRPAKQYPFHLASAPELILSGGKRSGKTTGVATEFASRVLGIPITKPGRGFLPLKWPVSKPDDPLLYWVIGWDVDHIGQTIFNKLFSPGLFRVIPDKFTGRWRVYNPAKEDDADRYKESQAAGPLIPERYIDTNRGVNGWVWENAGANNFSCVFLKNGATICAYPSSSKHAKMGDAVAGIWIDEDIQNPEHLKEWQDRLTDRNGWLLWSVWPHTRNNALCDLIDRAEECKDDPDPPIQHFRLAMSENPYIPENNKRLALGRMGSDEEIARRDRGDLMLETLAMYDFLPGLHLIEAMSHEEMQRTAINVREKLRQILARYGTFPREWTRYLSVDPSHTRTAVAFGVVPPPEWEGMFFGDLLLCENEIVARKCDAITLAKLVRDLILGLNYEAFIMDQNMGRQTRVGTDKSVFAIYEEAFAEVKIEARTTRHGFIPGCNIPTQRYASVREALSIGKTGIPKLMFVTNKTWQTQKEFGSYRKKRLIMGGEETLLDEPANPRKHDCMAAVEYLVTHVVQAFKAGNAYVSPEMYGGRGSPAYRHAMGILQKQQQTAVLQDYVHLGPGAAA